MSDPDGLSDQCYSRRVGFALAYAADLHSGQRRKGKDEPYLSHILQVCALVTHYGGTEDQIIAAVLHDAVEDQGGAPRAREIGHLFGSGVEDLILECSDSVLAPGEAKAPWRDRKESYLARLRTKSNSDSLLITACDKLANLRDLVEDFESEGEQFLARFSGKADGVRWYYSHLVEILGPPFPFLEPEFRNLLSRLESPDE